jgi:hypothetical protein
MNSKSSNSGGGEGWSEERPRRGRLCPINVFVRQYMSPSKLTDVYSAAMTRRFLLRTTYSQYTLRRSTINQHATQIF